MKRADLFCAIIVAILAVPASAYARCHHYPIHWRYGASTSTIWRTTEGSECASTSLHPNDVGAIVIVSKPHHGIAGKDGPFGVAYKPNWGFRGSDSFVYTITSNSNFSKGAGLVARVAVLVMVE
jgi:hypothetical protein